MPMKVAEFCLVGMLLVQVVGISTRWTCSRVWMTWTMTWALWMPRSWKCFCPDKIFVSCHSRRRYLSLNMGPLKPVSTASESLFGPKTKGRLCYGYAVIAWAQLGCCSRMKERHPDPDILNLPATPASIAAPATAALECRPRLRLCGTERSDFPALTRSMCMRTAIHENSYPGQLAAKTAGCTPGIAFSGCKLEHKDNTPGQVCTTGLLRIASLL